MLRHPHALRDAAVPSAVTVNGEDYPIDADGRVDCPDGAAAQLQETWAEQYGVDPDDLVVDGAPSAGCSLCGRSHDGGACWDLIDDGVCPWCDEYDGEHVAQHASSAHPEQWDDYTDD